MATAPKPYRITIDLSGKPKESFETIFFRWAINAGRIIIVLTELIALGALFYRFGIDRQIVDLHDQITKQKLFVTLQQQKEDTYRSMQEKLSLIKQTDQETKEKLAIMNSILATINDGMFTQTNLSVNKDSIIVSGNANTIFDVNNTINNLVKKYHAIQTINVGQIDSISEGIRFKLDIQLKQSSDALL